MSNRKYTEFDVGRRVNVSSSGDYSFNVHVKGCRCKWLKWDGHTTFWSSTAFPAFPKYVMRALEARLLEVLKAEDTVFYEKDQYGGERTKNLRYHDAEYIQRWIARLEREQGLVDVTNPMQMKWLCVCGHELKTKGYRKSVQFIGTEVSGWCDHCSKMVVVYVDETGAQAHVRTLRDEEPLYYGDEA